MPPTDASQAALLQVVQTLGQALEASERERTESKKQIARLVAMVEGLTAQLDVLLRDRDEERRAELARVQEEARALAAVEVDAAQEGPEATPDEEATSSQPDPGTRHEQGRAPKPDHLERDVEMLEPEQCSACGSEDLLIDDLLVSEEYDFVRAYLRIRRIERTTCRCSACVAGHAERKAERTSHPELTPRERQGRLVFSVVE